MLRWTTLLIAISALGLVSACEDSGDSDVITNPGTDNGGNVGNDVTTTTKYFAVMIEDSPTYTCSTNQKAHGADMDAMELVDGSDSLAYADTVDGQVGDLGNGGASNCPDDVGASHQDLNAFKGAPDGTLSDGYVALGGGWLIAEFTGALELLPAYTLYVYEVGVAECGSQGCQDEDYRVAVTPGLTNTTDKNTVSSSAAGTAIISLTGI